MPLRLKPIKITTFFFAISLCLIAVSINVPKADAAISFVGDIATANSKTSGTTLTLTVPAGGVSAGNSIIISVANDVACFDGGGFGEYIRISSITDTAGNSYGQDVRLNNESGGPITICAGSTVTFGSEIWSSHNVQALTSGNTITINFNQAITAKAATAMEFSGLALTSAWDKSASIYGSGTTVDSTSTSTTSIANELLIGAIGVEGPSGDTFTKGTNYTDAPPTRDGTSGGGPTTNATNNPEYRIVSATGTYSADATLGTNRSWVGLIATFKEIQVLDHYGVVVVSPQTAGVCSTGTNTITAQDAVNQTITQDTSVVNMTSSGTGVTFYTASDCITPTTQYTLSSGVANIYYKTNKAQSFTITATKDGSTETGTSSSITVNPGSHTRLVVTLPGQTFTVGSGNSGFVAMQQTGSEFTIPSITATDDYFNVVTSYSGSKTLAYSGPAGTPSYTTSVNFTSGQSTTTLLTTLSDSQATTITVTDGGSYGYPSSSLLVNSTVGGDTQIRGGFQIRGGTSL